MKPTIQPAYNSQPVQAGASSLLGISHRSSSGSRRQSRVGQAAVNSRSSYGTDEAVTVPNILYTEDPSYHSFLYVKDDFAKFPRANAVQVWLYHLPIT